MESATLTRPGASTGWAARLRAVPATGWAAAGLALVTVAAVVAFLVYPTFPNYDSYYSMLWAREALHLQPLSFDGYRTPTEHRRAPPGGPHLGPARYPRRRRRPRARVHEHHLDGRAGRRDVSPRPAVVRPA